MDSRSAEQWDRHWSELSRTNALNPAQTWRGALIMKLLAATEPCAPFRVIDIGCGSGELCAHLGRLRADAELVGLDISEAALAMARQKVPSGRFRQCDLTRAVAILGLSHWATHAVCTEVLEHVDDPHAVLRNVRPLLEPGGQLVITVPGGPMSAFDRHLGHRRHFTPASLRETIADSGFRVCDLRGAGFPFFNLYRLAVIARGERLVHDLKRGERHELSFAARAALRTFGALFKLELDRTRLGWQLLAVATPV